MNLKDKVETIQSIITIIAILIGGTWTYLVFIKDREHYPHANIEQVVSHIELTKEINLVRIEINLKNSGNCRLFLKDYIIRLQQVLPITGCAEEERCPVKEINAALQEVVQKKDRFSWPLLAKRVDSFERPIDIEPDENQIVDFEFAIDSKINVIRVYSHFMNEKKLDQDKNGIGWGIASYYRLDTKEDKNEEKVFD